MGADFSLLAAAVNLARLAVLGLGGGMLLAFGMVCALLEASKSGKGQVVDAAMVDGAASLMAMFFTSFNDPLVAVEVFIAG